MKLWSKGLGKLELPFDLNEAETIEPHEGAMKIEGRIQSEKVNWPYTVKLEPEDMIRFTKLMATDDDYVNFVVERHGWSLVLGILGKLLLLVLLGPVLIVMGLMLDSAGGESREPSEGEDNQQETASRKEASN